MIQAHVLTDVTELRIPWKYPLTPFVGSLYHDGRKSAQSLSRGAGTTCLKSGALNGGFSRSHKKKAQD